MILKIMTFCMDYASHAEHIVAILRDSLCSHLPYLQLFVEDVGKKEEVIVPSPPIMIARLYVINDILYNVDSGNTTVYRSLLMVHFIPSL